jgi:prepilin-type N-terminal cleavage/methylation domain-containing protein
MKKFTLIELLVVIAIIGILASLLLPSLGKARGKSKAVVCLNNLKSLNYAFFLYADDNEGHIPASPNVNTPWDDLLISYDGQNRTLDGGGGYKYEDYGNSIKLYHCPENDYKNSNGKINRSYSINGGIDQSKTNWANTYVGLSMSGWWTENTFAGKQLDSWSMKLSAIDDSATAIMMTELDSDFDSITLGYNGNSAEQSNSVSAHIQNNPTKHVKAYSQNFLFADGHVSLMYLQSLAGDSGVDMYSLSDARGTYFDCQD